MDTNDQATHDTPADVPATEENTPKTWGRRELLKALAATGGAVALSNVPNKWDKPEVGFGVLPAHAQASSDNTGGGNNPIYAIRGCYALNANNAAAPIAANEPVDTGGDLTQPVDGIQMRRRIFRGDTSGTQLQSVTGTTNATGAFNMGNFTPSSLGLATSEQMTILYEFVNSSDGTGDCSRNTPALA